nr:WGR domain-containing protein [Herbidospora cretacea]
MTYLELSEEGGGAHKFYEAVVSGTRVTITYGRIGENGQVKVTDFPTEEKARAAAAKKVAEKTKKGYAPAVRGVRQRRAVTRRAITSTRSTAKQAPVLWRFASGSAAFGIFVDRERCWVGNQAGHVYTLTPEGEMTGRYKLPDGVKCIVADDFWIYAGCDDGKVYDLSGKVPRAAYEIASDVDIYWLDIADGVLGVSDDSGRITTIDYEDEFLWARTGGGSSGWMVRNDSDAVYHGHSGGVARYDLQGRPPTASCSAGRRRSRCTPARPAVPSTNWPSRTARSRRSTSATRRSTPARPRPAASTSSPVTPPPRSTASRPTGPGCGSWRPATARRSPCSTSTSASTS